MKSFATVGRLLRRRLGLALSVAVVIAVAALLPRLVQRDVYVSRITAVYDQRDALGLPTLAASPTRFAQVAATLRAKLKDPEFLWQLARTVELSLGTVGDGALPDDSSTKAKVAVLLAPTLRAAFDKSGQALTISVSADDPLTAKRLAEGAMELFISQELRFEAESMHRLYEAHARFLKEAYEAGPSPAGGAADAADKTATDKAAAEPDDFVLRLDERVRELDIERRRLLVQVDDPAARTRLRVTVPASYDDVPARRPWGRYAVTLALLVIGLGGLAALVTALDRSVPWAVNARRVTAATGLPVLASVPRRAVRAFPQLTVAQAAALRDAAAGKGASGKVRKAWLAYQQAALALQRAAVGPVLLVVGEGRTAAFLHNLLSVTALDGEGVRLVLDGEPRDAMLPASATTPPDELARFLAGQRPWKDIRLSRSRDRAYDLVLASPVKAGDAPPRLAVLARLFTSLCRGYRQVFVRGHDPLHAAENDVLATAATDVFLLVEGRRTRLTTLKERAAALGPSKLRGVILIDV